MQTDPAVSYQRIIRMDSSSPVVKQDFLIAVELSISTAIVFGLHWDITEFKGNGGRLEKPFQITAHASVKTMNMYHPDRRILSRDLVD